MMRQHLVTSHVTTSPSSAAETADLRTWASAYKRLHVDLGTGDGAFAIGLARRRPDLGVIAIDACLDHLDGSARRRPGNVRFVRLDARDWRTGLLPAAENVTINFPYGSLLRSLVEGDRGLLGGLDALLGPGSRLEVRLNASALVASGLDLRRGPGNIVSALGDIGDLRVACRDLGQAELRSFPSTWAKRLGYGKPTSAWLIEAARQVQVPAHLHLDNATPIA